ncbi:MAG: hypothetical protein Q7U57_19185 [Methylovulum sp.]|nr:hypothetical protein [Methylovulum sp.]
MNKDDWTPEDIAFAAARQTDISKQDKAPLGLKNTKKTAFFYIVTRLLIGLIPTFFILSTWHLSSGLEVIAEYIQLVSLLILSFGFYLCYLVLWASKVNLIASIFYSACIAGCFALLLVMTQS